MAINGATMAIQDLVNGGVFFLPAKGPNKGETFEPQKNLISE